MTGHMHGMLFQYIPNILVHIFTLRLTSIKTLRCPDAVNFITLPPELSKSLVNEKNWLHNVNIFNSFHIFNQIFVSYIYIYLHLDS